MVVGLGNYTVKGTVYVSGFTSSGMMNSLIPAVGTLSPISFKDSTVKALYHSASGGYGSSIGGSHFIEVTGNRAAGYITSVEVDGVPIGTLGSPVYNSSSNTTQFQIGAGSTAGVFGSTAGVAKRITIL